MTTTKQDLYPQTAAALRRLLDDALPRVDARSPFLVGPSVLRAPAPRARENRDERPVDAGAAAPRATPDTEALLGELVDMVLVSADEAGSGRPEVHLQFKGDVVEGLHLRLVKGPDGLDATFIVSSAAARRAVVDHVDALVERLRDRGFAIARASLDVA